MKNSILGFALITILGLPVADRCAAGGKIDVSTIVSKAEAESLLGGPVKDPKRRNRKTDDGYDSQCNYYTEEMDKSLVLDVFEVTAGKRSAEQQFSALTTGESKLRPVDGIGDKAAFFEGGSGSGVTHIAMLYILKGNVFISVGLGGTADANAALEQEKSIAKKILAHL